MPCIKVSGSQHPSGTAITKYYSGTNPSFISISNPGSPGYFEFALNGAGTGDYYKSGVIADYVNDSYCTQPPPPPPPSTKHDCINGGCVPSSTYNTPGKYASLADCQAGCAKDAACNGECVPREKIAELDQAINAAHARLRCR